MIYSFNCNTFVILQNKCARYWPEEGESKDYDKVTVKSVSQSSTTDYTLREFLVTYQEEERTVYHYHFQVSFHCNTFVSLVV